MPRHTPPPTPRARLRTALRAALISPETAPIRRLLRRIGVAAWERRIADDGAMPATDRAQARRWLRKDTDHR